MKKLFVTFGDGSENFTLAVKRIVDQAKKANFFDKCVGVNAQEFKKISPLFEESFEDLQKIAEFPYYYRAGKTYLIHEALHGLFGDFDVIIYADPGCELISNKTALKKLDQMVTRSVAGHAYAEQLQAPEWQYSKKYFLESVNATKEEKESGQIQATFSIFHNCHETKKFSREWINWSNSKLNYWQDPIEEEQEEGFISHRNDQSLFSILWKRHKFSVGPNSRKYSGHLDLLRSAPVPIQTIRNRTGKVVIPNFYNWNICGILGKVIYEISEKLRK